jgi:MoaD family protein
VNDIRVVIRAFANVRATLGAQMEISLAPGRTLGDLLKVLSQGREGFREQAFDSDGNLSEGIDIVINGRNVGNARNLAMELHDGDQVYVFPSLSGG